MIRSAASTARSSRASSIRIANSSPPSRATVSAVRTHAARRTAAATSKTVAGYVPETIVDGLEVVEIEEHYGQTFVGACAALQRVRHAVEEQCAVGEPGERIMEGLVRELGFERLALTHVACVEDDAA